MDTFIKKTEDIDYKIVSVQAQRDIFNERRYEVRFYYQEFDQLRMQTRLIDANNIHHLRERIIDSKVEILNQIKG